MKKAEKCALILKDLSSRYPNPLPPLDHKDSYTLLVAVMLSAQTTDKKVNEVTPALFNRANTPEAMAAMDPIEIQKLIRQIGLSRTKAKNLQKLSEMIVDQFNGQTPQTFEELEMLPGVGHKTASVVMSQAFGVPAFAVDTHIHRLAYRWGLSNGKNVVQTEKDLKRLFPESSWNDLHLQIIFFGREHCPARNHNPEQCPICSWAGVKSRIKSEKRKSK